ncbi:MAG: endonuclease/exonuclease/phosphatase family protein [Deltaproteobacteria bacterium]|nr:endonuclease/exonuclease/phosphatase family protein [Deltaproteobacteria bacterium]
MDRLALSPCAFLGGHWDTPPPPPRGAPVALRLLTWNVYFGGHMFEERADALVAELARRRPDVIALQEVTPELLAMLVAAPWVRASYQVSDVDGRTLTGYGVIVLSRLPIRRLAAIELPSEMGRRLLVAELACGLTVATVHLESMAGYERARLAQLAIIQAALAPADDVALVGDMNFAPASEEDRAIAPALVDVWPALHPDAPGYTVDTDVNAMRAQLKSTPTHKRIDRVFLRSDRWRAAAIERVGTEAIDIDGTFVSDHFGLEVALELREP